MNNDLYSIDFTRALPPPLQEDPKILALSKVIAAELQKTTREIKKNIIYARIDELDEHLLDILAYDLHIDWYDYNYSIDVKRAVIKNSVRIHRKLGTKYAVEAALNDVFPGTKVEEWFEYEGDPYLFRVIIGATTGGVSADKQAAVLERIRFYKNLRSHLEAIKYKIEKEAKVTVGAYHKIGQFLAVYPYLAKDIYSNGGLRLGVHTQLARYVEVYPVLVDKIEMELNTHWAGCLWLTRRLEIYPQLPPKIDTNGGHYLAGHTQITRSLEVF